jgi:cytosine/adenosine deaminase-related metal-dependent hydrolase
MIYACRWLLPIERAPLERAWIEVQSGVIRRFGTGAPPAPAVDLGDVALLPGLVNVHTHLELSWMAGRVPPAASMAEWVATLLEVRGAGAPGGPGAEARAVRRALAAMHASGTVLVGDVSNTLTTALAIARAGLGGVVFHELLGFNAADPALLVSDALRRVDEAAAELPKTAVIRFVLAAHAPYSVSPGLFREIAARRAEGPLTVHVGESSEEIEFLRAGTGPFRALLDKIGVWNPSWSVPGTGPVDYLASVGYLEPGLLAVHAVHLRDDELERLRVSGATVVTCPRSNLWVGAGMPRVSRFYASGVPVAIGTDSLASVGTLNMFDELAEMRRIAPDVTAATLLESATRVGADALGFGATHGTIAPGRSAALIMVAVAPDVTDVEEYLVSGVAPGDVRHLPP